jgi:regulator of replication initiation timing
MEPISATLAAALATLRVATEAAKKLKNKELSEELQEIYDRFAEIRLHLFNLEDENRRLQRENEELKSTKEIEKQMTREGEVYYRTADGKKTGPFCPLCWDADRKLVGTQLLGNGRHICNIHKVPFANPGHETSEFGGFAGGPSIRDKIF